MAKIEHDVLLQEFRRPVIYLDHWALMRLAEEHSERFASAVARANATVLLTMGMLVEFHSVLSERTAEIVEDLLNAVMPHIYVSDPSSMDSGGADYPVTDSRVLALIALCPRPMDVTGLIQAAPLAESRDKQAFWSFCETVAATMAEERSKPEVVARIRTWKPDVSDAISSSLFRGLKRQSILDPNSKFDANDSSDLVHSWHAARFSDYALLDGKWADRVIRVLDYLNAHGLEIRKPQVYSERKGGLNRFLDDLDAAPAAESDPPYVFAMGMSEVRRLYGGEAGQG